jgi:formamidopyrimidine-DNA glycosylase
MPELPEVETVRRGLAPAMEGARIDRVICRRPDLRFAFPDGFVDRLAGRQIVALGRRAKYLTADLDDGTVLIMHLGMSGSFRIATQDDDTRIGDFYIPRGKLAAHDHVVFELSTGMSIIYNDPRRFGFMDLATRATLGEHPLMRAIGVEPLGNAFGPDLLHRLLVGRKTPLKAALLDQKLIAGLGNIYVCEALWRAHLSPLRLAGSIAGEGKRPGKHVKALAGAIREVLEEAIKAGGSSLRDYVQTSGELGYFQHRFRVYDCEGKPCVRPGCSGIIGRVVQSGRSTFYCAVCQG